MRKLIVLGKASLFFAAASIFAASSFLADATHPVVVFDESHGQRFHIRGDAPLDLSNLAALVGANGGAPELWTKPLKSGTLDGVSGLVISGPFRPIEEDEVKTITGFVDDGGHLAVMLHITTPVLLLLERLGIEVSNAPVREQENVLASEPLNFELTRLTKSPLTTGLERFSVYGAFGLNPKGPGVLALARTSARAFVDLDGNGKISPADAMTTFAIAVAGTRGKGSFVVFGDDALFQNHFLLGNNERLGRNLAGWMTKH